jgi:hypothetical protein
MAKKPKEEERLAPAAATSVPKYERHPLSEKFALPFNTDERAGMAEDIKANGQHQEIVLYQGQVLDGWERYKACEAAGVTPRTREYIGTDPLAVAFGANTIRRKLNTWQKALMGARLYLQSKEQPNTRVPSQDQIAKQLAISKTPLSEMIAVLSSDHKEAKTFVITAEQKEITRDMFDEVKLAIGLTRTAPVTEVLHSINDDDNTDDEIDAHAEASDDIADIDDLLGDDNDNEVDAPRRAAAAASGAGDTNVVPLRSKVGHDTKPRTSQVYTMAEQVRNMPEDDRVQFVTSCWGHLRPAIEKAIARGIIKAPAVGAAAKPKEPAKPAKPAPAKAPKKAPRTAQKAVEMRA